MDKKEKPVNEPASQTTPNPLPVRQIVLYKHGIGYVTRAGMAPGSHIELSFRAAEVDDALKSLTVLTLDGGQVTSIRYPTPQDDRERFAEIPIELGQKHALFDLLRGMRGVAVSVALRSGPRMRGRIVGVEEHPQGREHQATLVLQTEQSAIEQVSTGDIARLAIEEQRAAADLDRYLDASTSEETRRTVTIELDQPGRRVQVSYTVPSPVWRVSYRLVGQSDDGFEGRGLLQGWGVFDNRLEEDLDDVDVVLVAGQPVSFRYDLTSSVIPERRFVPDQARPAAGPIEFAGTIEAPSPEGGIPALMQRRSSAGDVGPAEPAMAPRAMRMRPAYSASDIQVIEPSRVAGSTSGTAEGSDLDELFEYRVGGVSVKRGESAMVPVVQHNSSYRRELLYNGAKYPRHPVVSLRMRNHSGLTLERGPVTVVEDGAYRGEAILPFTKADGEIVLAFAVELGVTVLEEYLESRVINSIVLEGQYLHIQEHIRQTTTYTLVNNTGQERVVTVEQLKVPGTELTDTRPPDEETGEERRWHVSCPARGQTALTVTYRRLQHQRDSLLHEHFERLSQYLQGHYLDAAARRALEGILHLRQALADLDQRLGDLRGERDELGRRQDRLRQNLSIQATNEQEHEIRRRSAQEFGRTQDREEEIERESERIQGDKTRLQEQLDSELARLG